MKSVVLYWNQKYHMNLQFLKDIDINNIDDINDIEIEIKIYMCDFL